MTESPDPNALPRPRRGRRWQFSLGALLGTLMVLCIPFALWGAFFRANEADQFWLAMLIAAAPLGVLILVALAAAAGQFLRNRGRSRAPTPADDDRWP